MYRTPPCASNLASVIVNSCHIFSLETPLPITRRSSRRPGDWEKTTTRLRRNSPTQYHTLHGNADGREQESSPEHSCAYVRTP